MELHAGCIFFVCIYLTGTGPSCLTSKILMIHWKILLNVWLISSKLKNFFTCFCKANSFIHVTLLLISKTQCFLSQPTILNVLQKLVMSLVVIKLSNRVVKENIFVLWGLWEEIMWIIAFFLTFISYFLLFVLEKPLY